MVRKTKLLLHCASDLAMIESQDRPVEGEADGAR